MLHCTYAANYRENEDFFEICATEYCDAHFRHI